MSELQRKVVEAYRQRFGEEPAIVVRAPGRVNLLGAHVDYNEGWVLPAAIERAVWLAAGPGDGERVTIKAMDFEAEESFSLATLEAREKSEAVTWIDYPRGVAWVLQEQGMRLPGLNIAFTSDVPIGAGVSSSAAVEVAFLTAWDALAQLGLDGLQKAKLGQRVENQYIGVATGIMDQFASAHGARDHLVLLDCRTLEHELIPLPPDVTIIIADSGVRRELASSKYNERRQECEEAVAILQEYVPGIRALRDVTPDALELYAHRLPPVIRRRAQHVVHECYRVLEGGRLLQQGDVEAFGVLIRGSHASSRDLYEVSILELDVLAATAWQQPGCYGARLTGAGFGGCVVVLAQTEAVPAITAAMTEAYEAEFGRLPSIFTTRAAEGARVVERR